MWQVLLAAAIAGSGYFAKQLLHKNDNEPTKFSSQKLDLRLSTKTPPSTVEKVDAEASILDEEKSSIFRFSSASHELKNSRKKLRRNGGNKGNRNVALEKKISDGLVDDTKKNGKKFVVCLKKRRIGRNASAKCDSIDIKDKSSFGYGVGVGIMYMLSAGKAEIEKLNTSVDETAKVVHELKAEIYKRISSCKLTIEKTENLKRGPSVYKKSCMENDDIEVQGLPMADEGEYASSSLTEEPHGDVLEMDQLEAELESELLKLQVSTSEESPSFQHKASTEPLFKTQDLDLKFNQCNGVMPSDLDQKLCHLLIEQQETQIVDLESELQLTNSKLAEKESELQALKDCVKRLTDLSLTCPSDEETEGLVDEAHNKTMNGNGRSMVGIKRAIDFD